MVPTIEAIATQIDKDTTVLYRAKSIFPFELFPTEIVVYPSKVDIVDSLFFWSKDIMTIPLSEIFSIEVQTTPFFSTLQLTTRLPMTPEKTIKFLNNTDALEIRRIVQGLVIAHTEDLKLGKLSTTQLKKQAQELGKLKSSAT